MEELSTTTSEKLFWMNKGGKYADILKNYSTPKDAEVFMLDDRARRIVFILLSKPQTFTQALEYPYNSGDKLSLLYKTDKIKFIELYVLPGFNEEKFNIWIEQPLKKETSDLFEEEIPVSLFEKVFSLPKMSDWVMFMKLVDNAGYRVMRNEINSDRIVEAICKVLSVKYYISLASCFLDALFNSPYYNFANANKYIDTLISIFEKNDFSTRDFVAVSKRNKYFDAAELSGHDLDVIKDRLRSFVLTKLGSIRKYKASDYRTIKTLYKVYEKAAPQVADSQGRYSCDYDDILNFYSSQKKNKSLPEELKNYIGTRVAFLTTRKMSKPDIHDLESKMSKQTTAYDVTLSCDKEDAIWLVRIAFGKKSMDEGIFSKWGLALSKLIFDTDITIHEFESEIVKANLRQNFIAFADSFIQNDFTNGKFDICALKLCAFLYEVFLEGDSEKANKYDALAKSSNRMKKPHKLMYYFQQRALHFFAYGNDNIYKLKCVDYDTNLPKLAALEKTRPVIEEKFMYQLTGKNSSLRMTTEPPVNKEPVGLEGFVKLKKNEGKHKPSLKKTAKSFDAAKDKALEIAGNLKASGMSVELIANFTGLMPEEIENL